jgi:UDP:flavonoid glycosyltransferase YjiC (YdhE family)
MLVEEMLNLVFEVHNPKWFMFDGAFPYRGMLNAIKVHPSMEKMWMKRGSLKANKRIPEDSIHTFDHIIHPSEFIEQTIKQNENLHTIPPITLLQSDEMMTRKNARHAIGVSTDAKVVYVQLGAGRINEINSDIRLIIDALLIHEGVEVVVGESMLGQRLSIHLNRVHVIRDYPNSLYFNGFDAAVQAGGYNSFHEMRMMGIPTLFLPNLKTGMDDQLTRCKLAESEGWGIVLLARDKTSIQDKCALLLSKEKSMQITENSGASAVAELILKGFN